MRTDMTFLLCVYFKLRIGICLGSTCHPNSEMSTEVNILPEGTLPKKIAHIFFQTASPLMPYSFGNFSITVVARVV